MVIKTSAIDAQALDSRILSIQHEPDKEKQTQMLNELLLSRKNANHRIAVSIMRSRANGTPLDEIEQTVREVCARMVLDIYKPFSETTKFDHQLLVKAGDRVLAMRRLTTNHVASGMYGVSMASIRCSQIRDELTSALKREPSKQEVKQRYLDLYGSDAPETALSSNVALKVKNSEAVLEDVAVEDRDVESDVFGADHYVRISQTDGSNSSVELSDIISMILSEASEIDPSGVLQEYIKAWLESQALGEPPSQRTITVIAPKIGVAYRDLNKRQFEEHRENIFRKVLTTLGASC